jgi:hypothetical protein
MFAHAYGTTLSGSQGGHPHAPPQRAQTLNYGPGTALLDKVWQLDALLRLGALQTLDLKGNEIRVSLGCLTFLLCCVDAMAL